MNDRPLKIVYCTPALYSSGGIERVITLKANYLVDNYGYNVTIIVTEGYGRSSFFSLSSKIDVVNFELRFEELWDASFIKKIILYIIKQRKYKKLLTSELKRIEPDIIISTLRREINFLTRISDGSKKIGEIHLNRFVFRSPNPGCTNFLKKLLSKLWLRKLVKKLNNLDKFVVLTEEDKNNWLDVKNVIVIPDPLALQLPNRSKLKTKRVIAVGRYTYQKGFDLLLKAWARIENEFPEWHLSIYGDGDRKPYELLMCELNISMERCHLYGPTKNIEKEYLESSLFVFSSRFEGFGMVLIEAMACGLPVVSFSCPCGPRDIIEDGFNGLLVESEDIRAFSYAMKKLMTDVILCKKMSDNAVASVQKYALETVMEKWRDLFESVVNK